MSEHNGGGGDTNRRGNQKKGKKNRKYRNGYKNTNKNFNQRAAHSDQKQDNSGDGRNSHVKDLSSGLSDSQIKKSSEPNASPSEPIFNLSVSPLEYASHPSNYESRETRKSLFGFDPSVHQPVPIDDTIKEKSTMKKSKSKEKQSEEFSKPVIETAESKEKQSQTEFRRKLVSVYNKGLDGAFIFKVGSQEIKISETFFAAQSKVFADLMLSKKKKSENNEACFDNLNFGAVQQFVNFIHSKSTKNLARYVEDVLKLADEYDVMELKTICVQYLKSRQLTEENIFQSLFIAFKRQDEELKKKALDYVAQSTDNKKFFSILLSEDWFKIQLENPHLTREIMLAALTK